MKSISRRYHYFEISGGGDGGGVSGGGGINPLYYCKAWYLCTFGAYACIVPYLALFYRGWGQGQADIARHVTVRRFLTLDSRVQDALDDTGPVRKWSTCQRTPLNSRDEGSKCVR